MKAYTCDDNAPLAEYLRCYSYIYRRNPALWLKDYSQAEIDSAMSEIDWRLDAEQWLADERAKLDTLLDDLRADSNLDDWLAEQRAETDRLLDQLTPGGDMSQDIHRENDTDHDNDHLNAA